MHFSETEIQFLLGKHHVIVEPRGNGVFQSLRTVAAINPDPRDIGMPVHMFQRILERRAKELGGCFAEFRNRQGISNLDARLRAQQAAAG